MYIYICIHTYTYLCMYTHTRIPSTIFEEPRLSNVGSIDLRATARHTMIHPWCRRSPRTAICVLVERSKGAPNLPRSLQIGGLEGFRVHEPTSYAPKTYPIQALFPLAPPSPLALMQLAAVLIPLTELLFRDKRRHLFSQSQGSLFGEAPRSSSLLRSEPQAFSSKA